MLERVYCQKLKLAIENTKYNRDALRNVASRLLRDMRKENVIKANNFVELSNQSEDKLKKLNQLYSDMGCD